MANPIRVGDRVVDRSILDHIEQELRQYQHRHRRYEYLRLRYQQIPMESPPPGDGLPRGNGMTDPTSRAAERLEAIAREMAELAAWVLTVDNAMGDLTETQREILQQMYILPRSARQYTMVGLAYQLDISEREAYRARNEALLYLALSLHGERVLQNPGRILADSGQA